jgi:hypothetical protein
VSFAVAINNAFPTPTFTWYKGAKGSGTSLQAGTSPTYQKTGVVAADSGNYYVIVSNLSGADTSAYAHLTVNGPPSGLSYLVNPATYLKGVLITPNTAAVKGAIDSLMVSPPLPAGLALSKITGTITGTPTSGTATAAYVVTAKNQAGIDTATLTITVNAPPSIQTQPASISKDKGLTVTFSVAINTDAIPAPIYQWQKNGTAISAGTNASATTAMLTINPVNYSDQGNYRVVVSNSAGSDTSNSVTLTVLDITPPTILLKGAADTTIAVNSIWVDPGDSAWDDRDGVITSKIVTGGTVNTAAVGKYTKTYDVKDSSGNAATEVTRIVRVVGWQLVNNTGITAYSYLGFQMKLVSNNLYIVYADNTDKFVYVKKLVNGTWLIVGGGPVENFAIGAPDMISLAVSPDGTTPYVGYIAQASDYSISAHVARLQGGSWQEIYTSNGSYTSASFIDVEISPDGSVYAALWPTSDHPEVVMKYDATANVMDSLVGISPHTNYYTADKDSRVLAFAADGTPYVTYRGPGGFTIRKGSGSFWIGAGATAADSVFNVAYSTPLQTYYSNNNLFVLVSNQGENPSVYDLKSGSWSSLGTITPNGSDQPCLSAIGDTAYVSYVSYQNFTDGSVYVNEIVNGTLKNVPEVSSNGLAISGTFSFSWVEAGPGIVYAAGKDQSGVITLMEYVKQ